MSITLTPDLLRRRRAAILADLKLKLEVEDFHGVQDCASDLREIDAGLAVFEQLATHFTAEESEQREYNRRFQAELDKAKDASAVQDQIRLRGMLSADRGYGS